MDRPTTPSVGQSVAIIYSAATGDEMVGAVQQVNERTGLAMVLWPNNPIEDWVENASLTWSASNRRWEMTPEG